MRQGLDHYRKLKDTLEALNELNQQWLRRDRDQARGRETRRLSPRAARSRVLPTGSSQKRWAEREPRVFVTDKLRRYGAAKRTVLPSFNVTTRAPDEALRIA